MQDAQSVGKYVNVPGTNFRPGPARPAAYPWATTPIERPVSPPSRARVVAVASLSRGVGRTTLSQALVRALSDAGEQSVLVRLDTRHHHTQRGYLDRVLPQVVTETSLEKVLADESHATPLGYAVLDLPPNPCVEWARGLEVADDVIVLVQPGRDDLSTIGAWFRSQLGRVRLVASRIDDLSAADRRGLRQLREIAGERLLDMNLHENAAVEQLGVRVLSAAPASHWSEEVRRLAAWVRSR